MKNLFKTKNILSVLGLLLFAVIISLAFETFAGFIPFTAMALIPITNLDAPPAGGQLSGIAQYVYVIDKDDILTWPLLPTTKTSPEDTVNLVGDFVLKPGKYWRLFYSSQQQGEMNTEPSGNIDQKYLNTTGAFKYPKNNATSLGLANILLNRNVVIIVKEFDCSGNGVCRIVGSDLLPAKINPTINSGKAYSDEKGVTFNFEATSCSVPPIYTGVILTEAGSIQTPTQLTVDVDTIDGSLGSRFTPNASQTADLTITTYTNNDAGNAIRVENNLSISITLTLANGGSIILTENKWADLYFYEANTPVVSNTNV